MKKLLFLGFTVIMLPAFMSFSGTIPNKFGGIWYKNTDCDDDDDFCQILKVRDTTSFDVISNQLYLDCKNVFTNDTLFLYVVGSDAGRGFTGPYFPPKRNSLFAKCYLEKKNLKIIYTQKLFKNKVKAWQLPTTLYRHD